MVAPILVLAMGNESRGDDALGPTLLRELAGWIETQGLSDRVETLEEFQLQIENAMDMRGRERVLFIDAGVNMETGFRFTRVTRSEEPVLYSHALPPEALMSVYARFYQETPPAAYVCCVAGDRFELGASLSAMALQSRQMALVFLQELFLPQSETRWDVMAQQKSVEDSLRSVDNSGLSPIYQYVR